MHKKKSLYTIKSTKKIKQNIIAKYNNIYIYNIHNIDSKIKKFSRLNNYLYTNNVNSLYLETGLPNKNNKVINSTLDILYLNINTLPNKIKYKNINKLNYTFTSNENINKKVRYTYNVTLNNTNNYSNTLIYKLTKLGQVEKNAINFKNKTF